MEKRCCCESVVRKLPEAARPWPHDPPFFRSRKKTWANWLPWNTLMGFGCLIFIFTVLPLFAEDLPKELEHLAPLAQDQTQLTEAIRSFDKSQMALVETEINQGAELSEKGSPEQAKEKLSSAKERKDLVRKAYEWGLSRYPKNARLHNYFGELLYDQFGDFNGGVRQWLLALQEDPDCANAHNNLGLHFFHSGEYRQGLDHLDRALRTEPNNPDFLFNMAQIYLIHGPQIEEMRHWKKEKIYKEAMKMSKKAMEASPEDFSLVQDYAVNFFAAENFGVTPKWKDAARAWQQTREKAQKPIDVFYAWLNEARVWLKADDKEKGRACLEEALQLQPDSPVVKDLLNDLAASQQQRKEPKNPTNKAPRNFKSRK